MNTNTMKLLEYDKIRGRLADYAISEKAKELAKNLTPSVDIGLITNWLDETSQARAIADRNSSVPLHSLNDIDKIMGKFGKGMVLTPEELMTVLGLLECVKRLKKFMASMGSIAPSVAGYASSMYELEALAEEIRRCIEFDRVSDKASTELARIRKKVTIIDERMRQKLMGILNSSAYAGMLQDSVISIRSGRYVIPIKKEYRKSIEGSVLDSSSSGSTLFIEPAAVGKLHEEINILKLEEENEVYRILSCLTGLAESCAQEISINVEAMVHYDFLFAKAKFSKSYDGKSAGLNTKRVIRISGARHPLIGRSAVPLDFMIGDGYRALVITGPNTGGKTVALKTVGLLTMMIQSGLHVPVEGNAEFAIFLDILADIGDGQSIEQSLSTFSSHIRNITHIIENASRHTLVILDELGAGTDPGEGTGLAISVLEEVFAKGATIMATTHYNEIKSFAAEKPGFTNGCMEFDINTLRPLYRLRIGEAGESNAFLIALRLGIGQKIIERAHEITYKEKKSYTDALKDIPPSPASPEETSLPQAYSPQAFEKAVSKKAIPQKEGQIFSIGDCVYVSSMERTGIVCELENSKGELGVMVMKKKLKVNRKRLSLYIAGSELYPDEYDYDIILDSKENRKKKHLMGKRHVEGLVIERPE